VEDDVSIMQDVTLGGTGKETGDRHPKIRRGVLLSLGAKVLGNIEIGEYSRIGAGSVVLRSVPAGCTAVGVPAKLTNCSQPAIPSQEMDQLIDETEQDNKI
jgi:serine O-acetyltransferase